MKRILLFLSALFIATTAIAHTINWYVDGSVYHTTTCESGENVTPPTAPEKYGYTFRRWDTYAPIEYLESTGTQYIDTGVIPNTNTSSLVDFEYTNWQRGTGTQVYYNVIGSRTSNVSIDQYSWTFEPYSGSAYAGFGVEEADLGKSLFKLNVRTVIYMDKYYWKKDGIVYASFKDGIIESTYPMFLFGRSTSGKLANNSAAKIYHTKIYDNNVLVRNFIPVLDKDGTPCMYDLVEHKFYYNAGTGDFIAGPIVGE